MSDGDHQNITENNNESKEKIEESLQPPSETGNKNAGWQYGYFEESPDGGVIPVISGPGDEENLDEETKALIKEMDSHPYDRPPLEVTVVGRDKWKAIPWSQAETIPMIKFHHPLVNVMITHTGTKACSTTRECKRAVRILQRHHISLGYPDILYNFLIGGDGKVYEGRGWHLKGGPIPKYPDSFGECLKIAHIGYYGDNSKYGPDQDSVKLQYDFIETGMVSNFVAYNAAMITDYHE